MPARKRVRVEPIDDWSELQLRFEWPEQGSYELIRPVVHFGFSAAERAQQTGLAQCTIYGKLGRFDAQGMRELFEADERPESKRLLPAAIRQAPAQLKAEYPPFRPNELASIWRIYGERGLAGDQGAVWLYGENLTVHHVEEPLAQYKVVYERDHKALKTITEPRLLETQFRSPQLALWEFGSENWHLVLRLPEYAPRQRKTTDWLQLPLLTVEDDPAAS